MAEQGITAMFIIFTSMTAYKALGWKISDFPNAYDYYHNLISLPLHTRLTDEDQEYIIYNYSDIVKKYV